MAQFRGTVGGNQGAISRLGSKKSGLQMTANGWNIGVRVYLDHVDGKDVATITLTYGSSCRGTIKEIGRFIEGETQ